MQQEKLAESFDEDITIQDENQTDSDIVRKTILRSVKPEKITFGVEHVEFSPNLEEDNMLRDQAALEILRLYNPKRKVQTAVEKLKTADGKQTSDTSYGMYMDQVVRIELLFTKEKEAELFKKIEKGYAAYRYAIENGLDFSEFEPEMIDFAVSHQHATVANLRLVNKIAKGYIGRGLQIEDLNQEGSISLMKSVNRFNYQKGYKLSTFATHWIRQGVSRAVAEQSRTIRVPVHIHDQIYKIKRTLEDFEKNEGRLPSNQEIAEFSEMSVEKVSDLLGADKKPPVSLGTPLTDDGTETLGDKIRDESTTFENNIVDDMALSEELERLFLNEKITPRQRIAMSLYAGVIVTALAGSKIPTNKGILLYDDLITKMNGGRGSYQAVGELFGVSRQRIEQEIKVARNLMRKDADRSVLY